MKNDFLTLIKTRRSIRAYKPDAVPADTLARVLEAGTYAPSAMGEQSATIVAVETKAYRDRLTKLNAAVIGRDVDPYYGAPVIVVVLGDGERANYLADGSCVLENLMLAAHAEGLGTVWVNREREIFDSPDGKALLRYYLLAIPQLLVQMALTNGLFTLLHVGASASGLRTLWYVIVMVVLYFISYTIQQRWVFAKSKNDQ